jgi:hypothetical protein
VSSVPPVWLVLPTAGYRNKAARSANDPCSGRSGSPARGPCANPSIWPPPMGDGRIAAPVPWTSWGAPELIPEGGRTVEARHTPRGAHDPTRPHPLPGVLPPRARGPSALYGYPVRLARYGMSAGLRRTGQGQDNACIELWPHRPTKELPYLAFVCTRVRARAAFSACVKICYNRKLLHKALGCWTP